MRRILVGGSLIIAALFLPAACGSDDSAKKSPGKQPPSGEGGQGTAGEPPGTGNTPSVGGESGSGGSAGSGSALGGAGGSPDVVVGGAGGEPTAGGSAGEPPVGGAAGSGGEGGAGGSGGDGPSEHVIYASFGTKLVWIEPDTGTLHEVGDMRSAQGNVTYSEVVLAYGGVPGEAWIVTPRYDATANRPPPELGKVDLCTGIVSELTALTRATPVIRAVEGLALHPNGTWYVSTGSGAGATQYLANRVGTLNATTRAVTDLTATVTSIQNDLDSMVFVGTTLYGIDVATDNSRLDLVTVNLTTGATTVVASPTFGGSTAVPLRIAYDPTRSKAYAWRPSDRNLLELSLVNGTATTIGETHAANVYPGEPSQGFTSAPVCP